MGENANNNNIWGGVISAGLGTVGQVLGGAIANKQNAKNQKEMQERQIAANKAAAERAYQQQKEMYIRTYNDTTYSAMRKQMEEAGLNPALMYGQGGSPGVGRGDLGGGVQASGASGPTGAIYSNPAQGIAGPMTQMGLQMAMLKSEVKLREAQADNLEADTEKKRGVDTALGWAEWMNKGATFEGLQLGNKYQEIRNTIEGATSKDQIAEQAKKVELLAEQIGKTAGEKKEAMAKGDIAVPMAIAGLANLLTDLEVKAEGIEKSKAERVRMRNQTLIDWAREENEDLARELQGRLGDQQAEVARRGQNMEASNTRRGQNTSVRVAKIQAGSKVAGSLFGLLNNPEAMDAFVKEMENEDW